MGSIKKVMYEQISEEVCTIERASEYYWYQNVLGLHPRFTEEDESYEIEQVGIRSKVFRQYIDEHPGTHVKTNTALFSASALHDKVILVADI